MISSSQAAFSLSFLVQALFSPFFIFSLSVVHFVFGPWICDFGFISLSHHHRFICFFFLFFVIFWLFQDLRMNISSFVQSKNKTEHTMNMLHIMLPNTEYRTKRMQTNSFPCSYNIAHITNLHTDTLEWNSEQVDNLARRISKIEEV